LEHAGGHSQAAGFTAANLEKLQDFYQAIGKIASQQIKAEQLVAIVEAEAEVKLAEINWQLWEQIEKFSPFGFQNERPIFLTRNLKIEGLQLLGKAQQHLKLMVSQGVGKIHKTIGFSLAKENIDLRVGDKIDLLFELGVNEWNGNRELQLKIIDLKKYNLCLKWRLFIRMGGRVVIPVRRRLV
jgi:single-stranded-DNA-specific exonuclease